MIYAGKTVVITGGTKGIGWDIAVGYYKRGAQVFVSARNDTAQRAQFSDRISFLSCDVRRPQDLHQLVEEVVKRTGRLDVFINNAGYSRWSSLSEASEALWDDMLSTNLKGVFFGCQAAAAHMTRGGSIINISSLASKRGTPNNAIYCASKFGMNGLTQALAKELGVRGIRVNGICPVLIATEGLVEALTEPFAPAAGKSVDEFLKNFASTQSALGRLPTGEEVANTCVFLSSEEASAITGQNLNVDCGVLPQ